MTSVSPHIACAVGIEDDLRVILQKTRSLFRITRGRFDILLVVQNILDPVGLLGSALPIMPAIGSDIFSPVPYVANIQSISRSVFGASVDCFIHVRFGSVCVQLPDFLEERKIDLLVVGHSVGRRCSGFTFGIFSALQLSKMQCPILLVAESINA
jgi:nucleotide-binding universal stress UspA family protein